MGPFYICSMRRGQAEAGIPMAKIGKRTIKCEGGCEASGAKGISRAGSTPPHVVGGAKRAVRPPGMPPGGAHGRIIEAGGIVIILSL
jgi:hypothetical protein